MLNEGWLHLQGSVYTSIKPVKSIEVHYMLTKLTTKYPYMEKCFKKIHQTDIGYMHDLSRYVDYDGTAGKYARNEASCMEEATHKRRGR